MLVGVVGFGMTVEEVGVPAAAAMRSSVCSRLSWCERCLPWWWRRADEMVARLRRASRRCWRMDILTVGWKCDGA